MKKLALLVFAALVSLSVISGPAPADAHGRGPIRGKVDVQFNMGVIFGVGVAAEPDTNIAYIGDIKFRGRDFTLVWFSVVPPEDGCTICYAEETWSIYDYVDYDFGEVPVPDFGDVPGVLTVFEPGNLVLAGSDRGIGTSTGYWMGWGPVTDVAETAEKPFDHMTGGHVFWHGSYDTDEVGPGTHFKGRFTVFPQFDN